MLFEKYIPNNTESFKKEVERVSGNLGIEPDWLMAVMYFESRLDPAKKCANSTATGLIQFLESTAQGLGTSTAALAKMTNVQQMEYVEKYMKPYKSKLKKFSDVYLAVFYPGALGKPDNYRLGGETLAKSNPSFDSDRDNIVLKSDVVRYIVNWVYQKTGVMLEDVSALTGEKKNFSPLVLIAGAVVLALLVRYCTRK